MYIQNIVVRNEPFRLIKQVFIAFLRFSESLALCEMNYVHLDQRLLIWNQISIIKD